MKEQLIKYKKMFKEMIKDLKTKNNRYRQIPNILTILRFLAPFVIIPSFVLSNFLVGFTSIIIFSFTDAMDGFIARKFNLTSDLGRDLDAIADKVFAGTLLISLCTINPVYLINLVLELSIGATCAYKKTHNVDVRTCLIGKIKTIILDILVIIGFGNIFLDIPEIIFSVMISLTATLQVLSLKEYVDYKEKQNNIISEEKKEFVEEIIEDKEEKEKTLSFQKNYINQNEKQKTYVKKKF